MSTRKQTIIFPWARRNWNSVKQKLTEPLNTPIDLAFRLSNLYNGRVESHTINDMFDLYYHNEGYAKYRVPENELVKEIIPFMAQLVLDGPKLFKGAVLTPLPDLNTCGTQSANVALTRDRIATLLACLFFGLFEFNYITKGHYDMDDFSDFSVINIFKNQNVFGWQCLINYFRRVKQYMCSDEKAAFCATNIIIHRKRLLAPMRWLECQAPICNIILGEGANGTIGQIDDSPSTMHVCYSAQFIGGDCYGSSLTQEEITFLIRPECLISMLFCMKLAPNEAVCIYGAEKINHYVGYASNARYAGDFRDDFPRGYSADGTEMMLRHVLICIDASDKTSTTAQYMDDFDRDLNKAYCGFEMPLVTGGEIATGNWGYGVFGGNMQVKFLQQVLAASAAGRSLVYYPVAKDFYDQLIPFINWIQDSALTVGLLYGLYKEVLKEHQRRTKARLVDLDIFEALMDI